MKQSLVKEKVAARLGPNWRLGDVAERAGQRNTIYVCRVLSCTGGDNCTARHTPDVQDAIAKSLGYSTSELFGPHAWFRILARRLREMMKERQAS